MGKPFRQGADNSQLTTGLAGCGRMGLPMARAMEAAGIPVLGFDVRTDAEYSGVNMTFNPGHFAENITILFTVVRDEAETDALLFDEQAIIEKATRLKTLVLCSTLPPDYVTGLRSRIPAHIRMIDAPMSGAEISAQEGRLTFIIGGEPSSIDEMMLYFSAMGDKFHNMGELGAGMTAKVLNNLVAAASTAATRTALDWGRARGLDPQQLLHMMHDSSGQTWFGSNFGQIEFARDGYASDNTIGIMLKDIACASTVATGSDVLTPALMNVIRSLEPYKD